MSFLWHPIETRSYGLVLNLNHRSFHDLHIFVHSSLPFSQVQRKASCSWTLAYCTILFFAPGPLLHEVSFPSLPMSTKLLLLSFWTALAYCLALFPIFHRVRYVLLTSSYTSGYICPGTCVILDWIVIVHWQFSPPLDIELFKGRDNQNFLSFVFRVVSER